MILFEVSDLVVLLRTRESALASGWPDLVSPTSSSNPAYVDKYHQGPGIWN